MKTGAVYLASMAVAGLCVALWVKWGRHDG
jgi:hypothetical protein